MIDATRVLAPERTFTAVRAIAPVAGMPPKNPAAREASPCPHQLAVGQVVARVGHRGRHPDGEEGLDGCEDRHGCCGPDQADNDVGVNRWRCRRWQSGGQCPDRFDGELEEHSADGRRNNRNKGGRNLCGEPGEKHHEYRNHGDERQGCEQFGVHRVGERLQGGDDGVVAGSCLRAQRRRHLLEENDDGNAQGEALDDGAGNHGYQATEAKDSGQEHHPSGHETDHGQGGRTVESHDWSEHHHHGTGRAGHLNVGTAEDSRHEACDDCRDETRLGSGAGTHSECERQWQGHDSDGEAGGDVALPGAGQRTVVVRGG